MKLRMALPLAALAALGACSTATDILDGKRVDYKSAGALPPLEIPPDLTTPTRDNRYIVPETGKGAATLSGFEAERAQQAKLGGSTTVLPAVERMRIERAGSQRWLVVQETPEKLWPLVKDFWRENGFLVNLELPEAGVLETDWAENRAKLPQDFIRNTIGRVLDQIYSTPERDKFRTRMERAVDGGTEIYVSHRGMMEVYTRERSDQTIWQPRPPDPELEAEFLRRLMVRLGAQEERARQLASVTAPQASRAAIKKGGDGRDLLQVFEPFDRAWRRIGLALDRVGFTVEDRDRQKGLYFVRYADPEADMDRKNQEKGGLLGKLAFWRSTDGKVKAEQYRVLVKPASESSEVQILNKDGAADTSQTTRRILALLHDQLK
ncbi:MAG: outer membrane protein assembly factor BamC [Betaproteobacteria bacterium]|nr:MAG: outer membrane protein assembly factor BamC [Betaproteobacteria bacterium]